MILLKHAFTQEELVQRAFARVARVIKELHEEGPGRGHTRLLDRPLMRNEYVIVGNSVRGDGEREREHVVPLTMIYDECERRFENGEPVDAVATFIREHLKIVHVTKEERRRLDAMPGLKTGMPKGWRFGDDVFARLHAAGIEFQLTSTQGR